MTSDDITTDAVEWLIRHGVGRGDIVGLAAFDGVGLGLGLHDDRLALVADDPMAVVAGVEDHVGPRWTWFGNETSRPVAAAGITVARCWDVLTVHRLLHGRWRVSIAEVWARMHGLDPDSLPTMGQLDLFGDREGEGGDPDEPVRPDGHLRPEWSSGGYRESPDRMARWAQLAVRLADDQRQLLAERPDPDRAASTARSESGAEFMCAELEIGGLPIDVAVAHRIIDDAVGPRPTGEVDEERLRHERDALVLRHVEGGDRVDLRNPADVKAMLRRVAVDLPDTRAWRLEQHRDDHPVVPALLEWRKAERIATTYGYRWLDEHVGGGRLRGTWNSSDGAAGRMTASSGLHNLPAEMRPAVAADPGYRFVRADLGQIEPRVLAAVSGDPAFVAATADDDLYQPVARRLRVERDVAKVAVLGAMYGSTTGESAHALRGLERAYPTAMGFLEATAEAGRRGDDVFTIGGRRIRMWVDDSVEGDIDRARRVAAARGRFARNAVIQGAAAEFFKVWALTVRARAQPVGARVVLCLHDELLVHAPEDAAEECSHIVADALDEAAYRWSPRRDVRFVADVSVIATWAEAKG